MKNNKAENLREKLKQALTSTARVISDDIHLKTIDERNKKDLNFVDIESLVKNDKAAGNDVMDNKKTIIGSKVSKRENSLTGDNFVT